MVKPAVNTDVQVPPGTPNGTLFVCVARTYGIGKISEQTGRPISLEDCARGYWKDTHLSQAHAYECGYLMAHCGGEIKGVWKIDREKGRNGWLPTNQVKKPTWPEDWRPAPSSACHLIPDPEHQKLVGKIVRLGRSWNPLRGYFE